MKIFSEAVNIDSTENNEEKINEDDQKVPMYERSEKI